MAFRQLIVLGLLGAALSANEANQGELITVDQGQLITVDSQSVDDMKTVFSRSDKEHQDSIAAISQNMTIPKAVELLQQSPLSTPALMQAADMALAGQANLRKQPKGYSGIDGARNLLNDMIFESMSKYDAEIAKCTEYYSKQCAAMEVCRGQISAANYIAANSRALILDSQATINKCEVDIPERELDLKQHNLKCKHEIAKLNKRLKIVMGDIAVMTMILEMTDCEKQLLQTKTVSLLSCEDQCTHKKFVKFDHEGLQDKVGRLQSTLSHNLMRDTFADLFSGVEGMESLEASEFFQTGVHQNPVVNKTKFNNPPVPKTKVPSNPCNDPDAGAPSAADKRAAKCTIKKSPQCYKLQERFLLIQAGIQDERDELMEEISMMEEFCKEVQETLENEIQNDKDNLEAAQTKLAGATEKEATAGETARQINAENSQLDADLRKQMKTCSNNYIAFETELCALKKIRGELYKMKGGGHSAFFQDCEVSKWEPEECNKVCAGGDQKLTRSVLTHPNGGSKCLPLAAMRSCNNGPCKVNCQLHTWSGWSKCSAKCGGGVQQRLREVKQAMRYNGKPCGATSETKACNAQACEKNCELGSWTKWSLCSKDCDGGTKKRQKFIKKVPEGSGTCADEWSRKRLQYKECNMKRCPAADPNAALVCNRSLDVVLLIDGSGSLGKKGWAAEMIAAKTFVEAFSQSHEANMAVILYSGPRTWGGVRKCTGKSSKKVDPKFCGIQTITHFTEDMDKVKSLINGLKWPRGSTLTSLALMTAKAELALGRKNSVSNVIVFTDGRPLSFRKTGVASSMVRKSARLVWVPVTRYAPLKYIKKWATRRWQENVVPVKSFARLEKPDVITHIIANICPNEHHSTPKMARK
jgi:hypothetical protein